MASKTIRSILQIAAVLSMFLGAILTTQAVAAMVWYEEAVATMRNNIQIDMTAPQGLGVYGLISSAAPIFWGIALFASSRWISDRIGAEAKLPNQALQRSGLRPAVDRPNR